MFINSLNKNSHTVENRNKLMTENSLPLVALAGADRSKNTGFPVISV